MTETFGLDLRMVYHFLDHGSDWKCLSDIADDLEENKMTVRRSLNKMTNNDILEERNDGYRRFFRLKGSHIVHTLRTLKNLDSDVVWSLIQSLKKKVDALLLYGSRADGTNEPDSDWDLLVISDDMDPLELNKLGNKLEKRFGQVL
ncbi:MAG: nucleotidyltransferase domain-containing protein, partial [Thermoplasmatota archaeon]